MANSKTPAPTGPTRAARGAGRPVSDEARWMPNTDVFLTDTGIVIKAELAGLDRDALTLTVEGSVLRIAGSRADGCRMAGCRFRVMEIHYGEFESVIEVPEGYDLSQAKAAYLNGFLRVDVPLARKPAKPRRAARSS